MELATEYFYYFFESIDMPGYYLMMECNHFIANIKYQIFTRTGWCDETGKAEGYGYIRANVNKPFCHNISIGYYQHNYSIISYIKENKVAHLIPLNELDYDWGWFKFKEEINVKKWIDEWVEIVNKQIEERKILEKPEVKQTSLF